MSQTPRAERRLHYGHKEISEALTHEANSQFALFSVSLYDTQGCFVLFSHAYNTMQRVLLLLTLTTRVQYCHRKGGAWNCLVKVKMKQLYVHCAKSSPSAMPYYMSVYVNISLSN